MLSVGPFTDVVVPAVVDGGEAELCHDVATANALLSLGEPHRGALVAAALGTQLFVYTQVLPPPLLSPSPSTLVLIKRLTLGDKIVAVKWLVTPRQRLLLCAHHGGRMSVVTDEQGWRVLASFDLPDQPVSAFECAPVLCHGMVGESSQSADDEVLSMILNGPFGARLLRLRLADGPPAAVRVETMLSVPAGDDILRFQGVLGLEAARRGERYAYCQTRDQWLRTV